VFEYDRHLLGFSLKPSVFVNSRHSHPSLIFLGLALKSSPLEYLVTNALTYFVGKCITDVKGLIWLMCISDQFTNVRV